MTRSRKSRKPGVGSIGLPKDDKKKSIVVSDKKPKKKTGKKPGNRQQEATNQQKNNTDSLNKKDPRIGSKKAIDLGLPKTKQPAKSKSLKNKPSPIAAICEVEQPTLDQSALEQEIYAIEDDQTLQSILEKQESDTGLTKDEVDYFNKKMTRHQQLREQLGWSDDEEDNVDESESSQTQPSDEDDLWDKLDNNDFSEFE